MPNISDAILNALGPLWFVPLVFVAALVFRLALPRIKGAFGEFFIRQAARFGLPSDTYQPVHDVILPTDHGTTQIDHIFVSRFGVFVVETKNMKGWILGRERERQWTQKLYRKAYRFQNPLRQNYKHIKTLEALLDIPAESIHSVIAFLGDNKFKTRMPANVTRGTGFIRHIKSFQQPALSDADVQTAIERLTAERRPANARTRKAHIQHLKSRQK